jgi:hypothetical protein
MRVTPTSREEVIVEYSSVCDFELIVMSSCRCSKLQNVLMGVVTKDVLEPAPFGLTILPPG